MGLVHWDDPEGWYRAGGGRKGSGWGTCVYLWRIHVDIWRNQCNIVKLKNKKNKEKVYQSCSLVTLQFGFQAFKFTPVTQVQSLVRELRSLKLHSVAKKKKQKTKQKKQRIR